MPLLGSLEKERKMARKKKYEMTLDDLPSERLVGLTIAEASRLVKGFSTIRAIEKYWHIQGGKCAYCGRLMRIEKFYPRKGERMPLDTATFEHLHPKSEGGYKEEKNIVCACHGCNFKRGAMPLHLWLGKWTAIAKFKRQLPELDTVPNEIP